VTRKGKKQLGMERQTLPRERLKIHEQKKKKMGGQKDQLINNQKSIKSVFFFVYVGNVLKE